MQGEKQVVVFKLGDVQYGFPIGDVNEIIRYIVPTKIPNSPHYLEGIISLRGKIHATINLRNFLGLKEKDADDNTKIIIANDGNIGFIVDEVSMIVTPKEEEIDAASNLPDYVNRDYVLYILKMNGEIIIVMNMKSIMDISKKDKKAV